MGGKCKDPNYHRNYYAANRERLKAAARANYAGKCSTPEFKQQAKDARELLHFGCSSEEVFAKSQGKCVRCGSVATVVHHMDHDGRGHEKAGLDPGRDIDRLEGLCRACHINEHRLELLAAKAAKRASFWGRSHDGQTFECCSDCGRTDRRHSSQGLCVTCVARFRRRKSRACSL